MKTKERIVKVVLEFKVPTYIADDNTTVELTDKELKDQLKISGENIIFKEVVSKEEDCKVLDREHEFMSFTPNCKGLIYDESNKETYKHFVHHYLKNYYVDSNNSRHYINGGHWQHFKYDIELGLHDRMLNDTLKITDSDDLNVRDLILIHLMSGDGVRMYGTGQHYRRVRELDTIEEQKEFWKWVFDSKILNPNDKVIMSPRIKQIINTKGIDGNNKYKNWFEHYQTVGQLIVNKCWRDKSLEVLKWIINEYGLDLYKVDKSHNVNADVSFSNSLLVSIIMDIHDDRIHETYNNGVLSRLYDYNTKKLKPKKERDELWANGSFERLINFINFIKTEYPLLPLLRSTNYCNIKNTIIEYKNLEDFMRRSLLEEKLNSSREGSIESAESLISQTK